LEVTPVYCSLETAAGKTISIEVWIDPTLLDARITKVRVNLSWVYTADLQGVTVELPPDVIRSQERIDLQSLIPAAFVTEKEESIEE
jgi:hypothetical protein